MTRVPGWLMVLPFLRCGAAVLLLAVASPNGAPQTGAVRAAPAATDPPQTIEINAWPGERFVVLSKPALYCSYGYELYSCEKTDSCRGAVDTAIETKYHRARCDRLAGHRLVVSALVKSGKEWLVGFTDTLTRKRWYAKTARGACHELAFERDSAAAAARWTGKTVFSARGFITRFDAGRAGAVAVRLQDSLRVYAVRFGLTPLPTKPLWLMVITPRGDSGAIPVYCSWTNVAHNQRHEGNPWEDDIFEANPALMVSADASVWEIINEHHVRAGMTREQVRLSWGRPREKRTEKKDGVQRECWTYEKQRLLFDEKELVAIEEIPGPPPRGNRQ